MSAILVDRTTFGDEKSANRFSNAVSISTNKVFLADWNSATLQLVSRFPSNSSRSATLLRCGPSLKKTMQCVKIKIEFLKVMKEYIYMYVSK